MGISLGLRILGRHGSNCEERRYGQGAAIFSELIG